MTRREDVVEERLAEALGRPVKRCPACGRIGSHWLPERIENERIVPGVFTCVGAS